MGRIKLVMTGALIFWVFGLFAQEPDTLWTRAYGGSGADKGTWVRQTSDGGFIVVGLTESFGTGVYVIKTDQNGDTLWTHVYDNMNGEMKPNILQTDDGGYLIADF